MSEIYNIFEVEKYNDIENNDKGEIKNLLGIWEKDNDIIRNVLNSKEFKIVSEDICTTIKNSKEYDYIFDYIEEHSTIELEAVITNQERGIYYPRIFKPIFSSDDLHVLDLNKGTNKVMENTLPINENQLINSLEQMSTLIELLNKTFRTVYPCANNFYVFGFEIRNQLILACTEFESQIVGVLQENKIKSKAKFYTTKDYVALNKILKLSEYEIAFNYYPDLPFFSPFKDWKVEDPTKSLEWYSNYNAVKHDRENNFDKGRLLDLLNAISGCYIMFFAQYGNLSIINERLEKFCKIIKYPKWKPEEKLIEPSRKKEWIMKNFNY